MCLYCERLLILLYWKMGARGLTQAPAYALEKKCIHRISIPILYLYVLALQSSCVPTIDYLEFKPITFGFGKNKEEKTKSQPSVRQRIEMWQSVKRIFSDTWIVGRTEKKQEQFQHMIKINIPVFIKSATVAACCSRRLHLHASGLGLLGEVGKK